MSTDIVSFQTTSTGKQEKTVSLGAIEIFLATSLPLMLLTFAAWFVVYRWVNRKDSRRWDSSGTQHSPV
jgi:hypothetical protein